MFPTEIEAHDVAFIRADKHRHVEIFISCNDYIATTKENQPSFKSRLYLKYITDDKIAF